MEGLVISTRSFSIDKPFMGNSHKEVTSINGVEIEQSDWRKISLPIYMLDLFSEVGTDRILTILWKIYPNSKLPDILSDFIKSVSDFIAEDDEKNVEEEKDADNKEDTVKEELDIQTIYEQALHIRAIIRKLMRKKDFEERFSECFLVDNTAADLSESKKYRLDDLTCDSNTLFGCYECFLNKEEYPFSPLPFAFDSTKSDSTKTEDQTLLDVIPLPPFSSEYKCYVIHSFKRKLSTKLGELYLKSLEELFGDDADYLIHDYDYGKRLLQSSFRPPNKKHLLLFKHNKGDVYEILNGESFSLLYLYVKFGYDLKSNVQAFVMKIEKNLMGNFELSEHYKVLNTYCEHVKRESEKLPRKMRKKITPSIVNLENCLAIGISNRKCLYEMMFNLMILDDYVLRNSRNKK